MVVTPVRLYVTICIIVCIALEGYKTYRFISSVARPRVLYTVILNCWSFLLFVYLNLTRIRIHLRNFMVSQFHCLFYENTYLHTSSFQCLHELYLIHRFHCSVGQPMRMAKRRLMTSFAGLYVYPTDLSNFPSSMTDLGHHLIQVVLFCRCLPYSSSLPLVWLYPIRRAFPVYSVLQKIKTEFRIISRWCTLAFHGMAVG